MSNYTKTTDFEAKDSLPTGDSGKIIRGAEFETEFDAIATAVATKADTAGPTFTGTLTFDTISDGTISIGAFVDEDDMSSNSAVLVPTQQSVKAYVDAQVTAQDLDFQGDSGGALSIDLDSETMTIAGGTGINTSGSGNTLTISVDSSISTLSGSDTLTNKNIDVDNNTVTNLEVSNFKATAVVIESEGIGSNDNDTTLPTSAAVKDYVDSQTTAQDLDFQADSGGALSIDLDSEAITFTGGTGIDTSGSDNAVTFAIDSTVTTLTDTQTLTNKTLTAPVISGNLTTDGTIDGRDVATDGTKLDGIEASATADQTDAEIRAAVEAATDSNVFTDADHTKLDGIEALADVTDTTNVTAAGALMDSELTNITAVKSLNQGVATTDSPTFAGLATSANVTFGDNDKAIFGAGSDLQIYHDGSNSHIKDTATGNLNISGNDIQILNAASNEAMAYFAQDGSVTLYHNGSEKLATASTGIDVTGKATADSFEVDATDDIRLRFLNASTFKGGLQIATTADDMISGSAVDDLCIRGQSNILFATGGNTERLRIDSSGNVGIGTSSPATKLEITGTGDAETGVTTTHTRSGVGYTLILDNLTNAANNGSGVKWRSGGFDTGAIITRSDSTAASNDAPAFMTFHTSDDGTENLAERMRIDSSGNVGIGTSSPATPLDVAGEALIQGRLQITSSAPEVLFSVPSGGLDSRIHNDGSGNFIFGTGTNSTTPTERMRIDSSGNLLVGKTSSDLGATAGIELNGQYDVGYFTRSAEKALVVSRLTNDGALMDFRKDGTTVGSIQSRAGLVSTIILDPRSGSLGTGITGSGANLSPTNGSGTEVDARNDIGTSTYRFKDLHLSGNVEMIHSSSGSIQMKRYDSTININNSLGQIVFGGSEDGGTTVNNSASIVALSSQNHTSTASGGYLTFNTTANNTTTLTERARIDSSGNLLVSGTSTTPWTNATGTAADSQLVAREDGILGASAYKATASTGYVGYFNRTSTDGGILSFNKDGTTVGSIGTAGGDLTINGQGGIGVLQAGGTGQFAWASNLFYPITDNAKDLGTSSFRFKDLYLSGNVTHGTTPSSSAAGVFTEAVGRTAYSRGSGVGGFGHLSFINGNGTVGSVVTTGSATAYNTSSDYRLKENAVAITGATDRLKQLAPKRFNFIADANTTVDGFMAHEVQSVVPEAITGTHNEVDNEGNPVYQAIDQSKLVPLLVATIQELEARITALETN